MWNTIFVLALLALIIHEETLKLNEQSILVIQAMLKIVKLLSAFLKNTILKKVKFGTEKEK